jgi:hypothetical protein
VPQERTVTNPPGMYNGPYYTRRELVDTRTWSGTLTPELGAWLGGTPHHVDGTDLLIDTGDPEPARARAGWILVRFEDRGLIVRSPSAAARTLEPAHPEQP